MEKICGDEFWNVNVTWNTNNPRFTSCFERTTLVWIPCVFLWVFSFLDIFLIKNKKKEGIPWKFWNISKLGITVLLGLLALFELIIPLLLGPSSKIVAVDILTPIMKLLTFSLSAFLLISNKKRGVGSSGVLFIFWFLLVICGIPQLISEILKSMNEASVTFHSYVIYFIYYGSIITMLILNCFVDGVPKNAKFPTCEKSWPEDRCSFPSRITFMWLNSLIWNGFKRPLSKSDLWELKNEERANVIMPCFEKNWKRSFESYREVSYKDALEEVALLKNPNNRRKKKQVSIIPSLIRTFWPIFICGSIFKFIFDCFLFINPFILKLLLSFVTKEEERWKGYFYAGLLLFASTIQTLVSAQAFNKTFIAGMRIRTVVISSIYRKSLRISNAAKKEISTGEIVNLMSVDAQRFVEFISSVNMIWSAPLQIIMALIFLWKLLGPAVISGLIIVIILLSINKFLAVKMKNLQACQMKHKDERIKFLNEILAGIKVLKLYAWESSFEKHVQTIRDQEINILKQIAILNAVTSFIWSCAPFLISVSSFGAFVLLDERNVLNAEIIFVSLSLFNVLHYPLKMFPTLISQLTKTLVSVKRINEFMNSPELCQNDIKHDLSEKSSVLIQDGNFDWFEEPILKNININFEKGKLTAVVGSVGSGKSSLLSAILGEMNKTSGRVNVVGKVAYLPQQAWILNATLRENILFGKPFDKQLYETVLKVCELLPDIETFEAKDETEIGEKGNTLSGGQKQRVSLARALYSSADIYLLDDPLSAVDSHVGNNIFENVIGPNGVLKDKTRIFVTHNIKYLPNVDRIVVMKEGMITENGKYNELMNNKEAFSEFITFHTSQISNDEQNEDNDNLSPLSTLSVSIKQKSKSQTSLLAKESNTEKLISPEKTKIGTVDWSAYKYYFKSIGAYTILAVIVMHAVFQSFSVASNFWLSKWSNDQHEINNGTENQFKEHLYLGVYGLLGLGQAVSIIASLIALFLGTLNGAKILHNVLLFNVIRASCNLFFDITPVGRILNRFSEDIYVIDSVLPENVKSFLSTSFSVVATLFVISFNTPIFIVFAIPLGIIYYFVQKLYIASSRQLKRLQSVSRAPIYSHFSESLAGTSSIRAYGVEDKFIRDNEQKVYDNQKCHYPNIMSNRWLGVRLEMIGNLAIFLVAILVVSQEKPNESILGLSIIYALQITQDLNWLVRMVCDLQTNIVNVERIKEYDDLPKEASWEIPKMTPSPEWPENGSIVFNNCWVRYRPNLQPVLKGLDFSIKGGEKIGVVGRTGEGKSSITLALFRIIELMDGEIIIDGINIATLGLYDLRSQVTIIPQDPVLFSGTLRMNLDPHKKYTDDEIWKAVESAHMKSTIKTLDLGLYHELQEGGNNFSVGQRQLICLARALLRRSKVLILDEATASVDLETDDLIQETIRTEFKNCTTIRIAHRLNTIMDSDRILVIHGGTVADFDTPKALLSNKNSIFYDMAKYSGLVK